VLGDWGCGTDDPGCDGEPSDAVAFSVVTVDNSEVMPPNYYTFDLVVEVEDDDDWTAVLAEADLADCAGCVFYQDALGGNIPIPAFFGAFPTLEFDCWYTGPDGFPNADGQPSIYFAGDIDEQDQYLRAVWHDCYDTGGGAFVLARYTIMVPEDSGMVLHVVPQGAGGPPVGTIEGVATSAVGWGACNEFAFDIVLGCAADLDGDGDTDQADLGVLLADWGCTSGCAGDIDGDDDTDQADLGILLSDWGCTP
jgi:hypothetical protein